jgi:mono/diheme cytochrome c family protein
MRAVGSALSIVAVVIIAVATWTLASCAAVAVPPPSNHLRAVDVPALVERGRYLAYGPAHCAACHGDPRLEAEMRHGREIPLSGGRTFDLGPLGTIIAPNITSDPVAGIGALDDDTLVRSLRYGISRHGEPLVPFMSFADMTDEDLQAVLSFLRSLEPVGRPVPPSELTWLGTLVVKLVLDPQGPIEPPATRVVRGRDSEYGRYLAHTVANCHGCHTQRSKLTGAFVGPAFAGGMEFDEAGRKFVSPNLTPVATGSLRSITEREFIERFRIDGRGLAGSPMPWESFARMTDADLGAIYRYLKTLEPAETPGA